MATISIKDLTKHFGGVKAVNNLSLSVEPGKITSIIGPNGSGKTTLVNLLTGMIPFDAGIIALENMELKRILPYDVSTYGITRTFQNIKLFEQMTVLDNMLVVLTERNVWSSLFEKHKE